MCLSVEKRIQTGQDILYDVEWPKGVSKRRKKEERKKHDSDSSLQMYDVLLVKGCPSVERKKEKENHLSSDMASF